MSQETHEEFWNKERITFDEFGNKIVVTNRKDAFEAAWGKNGEKSPLTQLGWKAILPDELKYSPDELRERQKDV